MIKTYPKGSSEKLSRNFRAYEFDCRCSRCTETKVDTDLVAYLQRIRDRFGKAVHITGPYRCPTHNAEIPNASKTSKHMLGMAADIVVEGVAPAEVAAYAESIGVKGIGLYEKADAGDDFVHIDTRDKKSFWYGHKQAYRSTFLPEEQTAQRKTYTMQLPRLEKGCKGDDVKALQQLLIANGYSCGPWGADGDFGTNTQDAVIQYQTEHDMAGDGIVGPATWGSLVGVK